MEPSSLPGNPLSLLSQGRQLSIQDILSCMLRSQLPHDQKNMLITKFCLPNPSSQAYTYLNPSTIFDSVAQFYLLCERELFPTAVYLYKSWAETYSSEFRIFVGLSSTPQPTSSIQFPLNLPRNLWFLLTHLQELDLCSANLPADKSRPPIEECRVVSLIQNTYSFVRQSTDETAFLQLLLIHLPVLIASLSWIGPAAQLAIFARSRIRDSNLNGTIRPESVNFIINYLASLETSRFTSKDAQSSSVCTDTVENLRAIGSLIGELWRQNRDLKFKCVIHLCDLMSRPLPIAICPKDLSIYPTCGSNIDIPPAYASATSFQPNPNQKPLSIALCALCSQLDSEAADFVLRYLLEGGAAVSPSPLTSSSMSTSTSLEDSKTNLGNVIALSSFVKNLIYWLRWPTFLSPAFYQWLLVLVEEIARRARVPSPIQLPFEKAVRCILNLKLEILLNALARASTWERHQLLAVLCALFTCTTIPLQLLVRDTVCNPFRSALDALLAQPTRRLARPSDEATSSSASSSCGALDVDEPVWSERLGREMAEDLVLLFFVQAYAQPESCDRVKPLFESIAQELLPRESDLSYILNSFPHLFPFAKPAPRLSLSVARPADGELVLPVAGAGAAPASAAAPHSVRIVSASALSSALAAVSTRSYLTRGPKRAQASATSTSALAGAPVAGSAPIGNAGDVPAAASTSPSNAFSASGAVGLQPNGATTTQLSTDQLVPQEEHKAHEIIITQSTSSLQSSAPPLAASTPVPNVYADANNSAAARVSAQGSLPLAAAQSASSAGLQPPQPASPTASRLPLVGLVNYTSTGCLQICYANTATQILFHCRKFRNAILQWSVGPQDDWLRELQNVFILLHLGRRRDLKDCELENLLKLIRLPVDLLNADNKSAAVSRRLRYPPGDQQDSEEFLEFLLKLLKKRSFKNYFASQLRHKRTSTNGKQLDERINELVAEHNLRSSNSKAGRALSIVEPMDLDVVPNAATYRSVLPSQIGSTSGQLRAVLDAPLYLSSPSDLFGKSHQLELLQFSSCTSCHECRHRHVSCLALILPLPPEIPALTLTSPSKSTEDLEAWSRAWDQFAQNSASCLLTLERLLENFFEFELETRSCDEQCNKSVQKLQYNRLAHAPAYLCLSLPRFGRGPKVLNHIDIAKHFLVKVSEFDLPPVPPQTVTAAEPPAGMTLANSPELNRRPRINRPLAGSPSSRSPHTIGPGGGLPQGIGFANGVSHGSAQLNSTHSSASSFSEASGDRLPPIESNSQRSPSYATHRAALKPQNSTSEHPGGASPLLRRQAEGLLPMIPSAQHILRDRKNSAGGVSDEGFSSGDRSPSMSMPASRSALDPSSRSMSSSASSDKLKRQRGLGGGGGNMPDPQAPPLLFSGPTVSQSPKAASHSRSPQVSASPRSLPSIKPTPPSNTAANSAMAPKQLVSDIMPSPSCENEPPTDSPSRDTQSLTSGNRGPPSFRLQPDYRDQTANAMQTNESALGSNAMSGIGPGSTGGAAAGAAPDSSGPRSLADAEKQRHINIELALRKPVREYYVLYGLRGIGIHRGSSSTHGHYFAYAHDSSHSFAPNSGDVDSLSKEEATAIGSYVRARLLSRLHDAHAERASHPSRQGDSMQVDGSADYVHTPVAPNPHEYPSAIALPNDFEGLKRVNRLLEEGFCELNDELCTPETALSRILADSSRQPRNPNASGGGSSSFLADYEPTPYYLVFSKLGHYLLPERSTLAAAITHPHGHYQHQYASSAPHQQHQAPYAHSTHQPQAAASANPHATPTPAPSMPELQFVPPPPLFIPASPLPLESTSSSSSSSSSAFSSHHSTAATSAPPPGDAPDSPVSPANSDASSAPSSRALPPASAPAPAPGGGGEDTPASRPAAAAPDSTTPELLAFRAINDTADVDEQHVSAQLIQYVDEYVAQHKSFRALRRRAVNNTSSGEPQRRGSQNGFDAKLPAHPLNSMLSSDSSPGADANQNGNNSQWTPATRSLSCSGSEGGAPDAAYVLLTKRRATSLAAKRWQRSFGLASKRGGFDNNDDANGGNGRGEPPSKCGGWGGSTDFGGGGPPPVF